MQQSLAPQSSLVPQSSPSLTRRALEPLPLAPQSLTRQALEPQSMARRVCAVGLQALDPKALRR